MDKRLHVEPVPGPWWLGARWLFRCWHCGRIWPKHHRWWRTGLCGPCTREYKRAGLHTRA